MRIVVNTSFLLQEQWTGVCRHMYFQLVALAKADPKNQFIFLFLVPNALNDLYTSLSFPKNVQKLKIPLFQRFREPLDQVWQRLNWPPLDMIVGHHDAYLSPAWTYLPSNAKVRGLFVYDMTCFDGDTTSINKSIESSRLVVAKNRTADLWIVNSKFTRTRLNDVLDIPFEKILLAYPGLVPSFTAKKTTYKGNDKYFLYYGSDDPRKNLATVLAAFDKVVAKHPAYRFHIVSKDNQRLFQQFKYPWLNIKPYVDDTQLMRFMDEAKAIVYASTEEGFGMPVLEALSYGIPVITSKDSSMVEITGSQWPWLVDASRPQSIESAIIKLIETPESKINELVMNIRPHLKMFDFSSSARVILEGIKARI